MTDAQATQLIQALTEMKEHIAVIREVTEITANLTDAQKLEIDNNSRARRGLQPRRPNQ